MKTETTTRFIAIDGKAFETREACMAHESMNFERIFVGLKPAQVAAAFSRDGEAGRMLAEAFEVAGRACARMRIVNGGSRRVSAKQREAAAAASQPAQGE